jgi:hypothetical protein
MDILEIFNMFLGLIAIAAIFIAIAQALP